MTKLISHRQGTESVFVNEFAGKDNCNFRLLFSREEFPSRIIWRTENFAVIPGLGPIGEAYLLILPIEPYTCMAALPETFYPEFFSLKERVTQALTTAYSSPIAFEHGPVIGRELGAGCCVEHAHLHLSSVSVDLLAELHNDVASGKFGTHQQIHPKRINSIAELKSWVNQDIAYLYYETNQGECWGFPITTQLESQFIRKKLAERLGMPDPTWDWELFPNKEKVKATWQRLTLLENNK